MGCVWRCARFHIGRRQLRERREHRGGRRGGGKIGHVAQAVRFTLGGWRAIDRRKRAEAFAGGELDWLAGRQRRRGIAALVRRQARAPLSLRPAAPGRPPANWPGSCWQRCPGRQAEPATRCRRGRRSSRPIPARDRRLLVWTKKLQKQREDRSWQFASATAWMSGPGRRKSGPSYRVSPCPAGESLPRPRSPPRALRPCWPADSGGPWRPPARPRTPRPGRPG